MQCMLCFISHRYYLISLQAHDLIPKKNVLLRVFLSSRKLSHKAKALMPHFVLHLIFSWVPNTHTHMRVVETVFLLLLTKFN